MRKVPSIHGCILLAFLANMLGPLPICPPSLAFADPPLESIVYLPKTSQILSLTPEFQPTLVKGITIYPRNPLLFDFIVDPLQASGRDQSEKEIQKNINYFFAALTVPRNELWVNLSPYEKDRIIPESLGVTEMGRDLLAQDYLLKQLTASLMAPDTTLGKEFWNRVYQKTNERFGTTDIAVNTFNKIWIVPSRAVVYQKWPSAFVVDSHLKVMMEADYLVLTHHLHNDKSSAVARLTADIIKELIIPKIEKEVNEGRHFAALRQIYHAIILAEWYKQSLNQSFLAKVYVNQNKINGIDLKDRDIKDKIYQRYLRAYRQGLYNIIKEDYDLPTGALVPRKYFAGGINFYAIPSLDVVTDPAMLTLTEQKNLRSDKEESKVTVRAEPRFATDEQRLVQIKERLYLNGLMGPARLRMDHGSDENLLNLGDAFGHALSFPKKGETREVYLSVPDGDKVAEIQISNGALIKGVLANIYPVAPLQAAVLDNPGLVRNQAGFPLRGVGLTFRIKKPLDSPTSILSTVFGSGKSIRDFDRRGPGDPKAKQDIEAFVNGGKDIMVKKWRKLESPGAGIVMQAINQPRDTKGPQDQHNYVLRFIFPEGVGVDIDAMNKLVITFKTQEDVLIKAELYSDHAPIKHLALEELYSLETLEEWIHLQDEDQAWRRHGTADDYREFKNEVIKLRELQFEANRDSLPEISSSKNFIKLMGRAMGLDKNQIQMAINPARYYAEIPFFRLDRLTMMLYTGQYLISQNLPMMAGSPYYATIFPPDDFIVQTELIGLLKPEVVRDQFYALLKLEYKGQFPHEVDIRHSSHVPEFLDERYRLIRADTELLAMLYIAMVLGHEKEYGIEWDKPIRGTETVGDIVAKLARYVLGEAKELEAARGGIQGLLAPKIAGDPRGSWRDGASSTFYGKYIYTLQYLMVPALKAIEEINAQKNFIPQGEAVNFEALIQTWLSARKLFEFTQTRAERIQALMSWFSWKIEKEKNNNEGLNFILALFEDAKKYYGINYDFDTRPEGAIDSIRKFLELYMPPGEFSGHALALDAQGERIKIDDTDANMFSLSVLQSIPIAEIKNGLKSEFLHVVFGGTATTCGELLTGIPGVIGADRFIKNPVSVKGPADIYEVHRRNYHTVKWISMEYKKLNGLVRQINFILNNGKDISPDVNKLILALMLRFDELARLSNQETQETLEPFADSSGGSIRLDWRPFGSAEVQGQGDAEDTGIHSGGVQGFNIMALPANSGLEELLKNLAGRTTGGKSMVESLRNLIASNPAGAREVVTKWLKEAPSGEAGSPAMIIPHSSNPGGIDLNTNLFNLTILNNENHNLPYSFYGENSLSLNIEGISPKIIHEQSYRSQ